MTGAGEWELVLTAPVWRALCDRLPEAVATAVIDFLTSALVREPRRVGKPLRGELAGIWSPGDLPDPAPHRRAKA